MTQTIPFRACFYMVRPLQWIKNGFVLAPLLFSFAFLEVENWMPAGVAFIVFCLQASACYIVNDIHDRDEDRRHRVKKHRPIAAGEVSIRLGLGVAVALTVCAVMLAALFLPPACVGIIVAYAAMQIIYSWVLKQKVIVDVMVIALGFILRVLMGGVAINVALSPWIILCTFMVTLFLGFGKRYSELANTDSTGENTRRSLAFYNPELLSGLITICCAVTIMAYALYTVEIEKATGNPAILGSTVFVVFGMFRYLYLLHMRRWGGAPERIVVRDRAMFGAVSLWLVYTLWAMT